MALTKTLRSPYPFFEEARQGLWITVSVSLFVVLFLWVFKPFGIVGFSRQSQWFFIIGAGLTCFVVLAFNHFLLPLIFPNTLRDEGWTVGKHILWLWWQLVSVGLGNYLFAVTADFLPTGTTPFVFIMLITFAIGIFPIAVIVLISHLVLYRRRLDRASQVNRKLKRSDSEVNEALYLTSENENEKIECETEDFLYAESRDNYVYICYLSNNKKKGVMLRSSLKRLEDQISPPWILRCHRSYIVNLRKVHSVEGNAQGYKLNLKAADMVIPVSRTRHTRILAMLQDM